MSWRHQDVYKKYLNQSTIKSAIREQPSMISFLVSWDSEGFGGKTYSFANARQKLLKKSLVKHLIINCDLAVSVVDDPNFRKFCYDMDPKYTVSCRQTVSYSLLPPMLREQQDKLQKFVASCSHLAPTADIWTDRRAHACLGVTVHTFLNGSSESHLLAFHAFQGSRTGQRIADALEAVIIDRHIHTKVHNVVMRW